MDGFEGLLREAMIVTAMLSLPTLAVAAASGTAVAILQAATQIQEQTLTLLPKVVAVGLTVALFGVFAMNACEALFRHAVASIPALVFSP